jgi:hypothetical protein
MNLKLIIVKIPVLIVSVFCFGSFALNQMKFNTEQEEGQIVIYCDNCGDIKNLSQFLKKEFDESIMVEISFVDHKSGKKYNIPYFAKDLNAYLNKKNYKNNIDTPENSISFLRDFFNYHKVKPALNTTFVQEKK